MAIGCNFIGLVPFGDKFSHLARIEIWTHFVAFLFGQ